MRIPLLASLLLLFSASPALADGLWQTDFAAASQQAVDEKKYLVVLFDVSGQRPLLQDVALPRDQHVFVRLTTDSERPAESEGAIRDEQLFQALRTPGGLAIIDYAHRDAPYYGEVVSVLPENKLDRVRVYELLSLPPGTLTQRTLTWAVRIHREPSLRSADGDFHPTLVKAASDVVTSMLKGPAPRMQNSMWVTPVNDERFRVKVGGSSLYSATFPAGRDERLLEITHAAEDLVASVMQDKTHYGRTLAASASAFGFDMIYDKRGRCWYGVWVMH
jgi:hypothetical protein